MAQLQLVNIGVVFIGILLQVNQIKPSQWVTTLYTWNAITTIIQIQNFSQLHFQLELLIIVQLIMVIGLLILI